MKQCYVSFPFINKMMKAITSMSGKPKKRTKHNAQPRGPDGRFLPRTYVVIDEFGGVSTYSRKERSFGYAMTITDDRREMEEIAKENRRIHDTDSEVKASSDTPWHKMRMAFNIRKAGLFTAAEYVDKRRPPHGWDVEPRNEETRHELNNRRKQTRNRMLSHTMDVALENTDSKNVYFVVDYHNQHGNVKSLSRSKSTDERTVDGDEFDSSQSKYKDLLQAHDYVTNAAGSAVKGFPFRAKCMRMRIRRLKRYDRI